MKQKESVKPSRNVHNGKPELRHHQQSSLPQTCLVLSATGSLELRLVSSAILEHTNNNTSHSWLGLVIVSNDRRRKKKHYALLNHWATPRGKGATLFFQPSVCLSFICHTISNINLTLVLLNLDISCLYKQCRSRSVGFWRSQLIWISTVYHSVTEYVSTTWIK